MELLSTAYFTVIPEKKKPEVAYKWGLIALPLNLKLLTWRMIKSILLQLTFLVLAFVKKRQKNWPLLNWSWAQQAL